MNNRKSDRYVIGDVHGRFDLLMRLVEKLPGDAELIFVGDLIDRGPDSAEVVRFVRDGGYGCVMGNHENMMVLFGGETIRSIEDEDAFVYVDPVWDINGATSTLTSYGLVYDRDGQGRLAAAAGAAGKLGRFAEDRRWMEALPPYIELDKRDGRGRPYVVSHAAIASVWGLRHRADAESQRTFLETALWSRRVPDQSAKIYNVFGHTPTPNGVFSDRNYTNVDTGAYIGDDPLFGRLSAFCVDTGKVVDVRHRVLI